MEEKAYISIKESPELDDESSDIFVSELLESNGFEVNMDNTPGRYRF